MKVSIAQIKYRAYNFKENIEDFKRNYAMALANKVDVLVFPSVFIGGIEIGNLVERPEYYNRTLEVLEFVKKQVDSKICVIIGHITKENGKFFDSISIISNHEILFTTSELNFPIFFNYKEKKLAILHLKDELLFIGLDPKFSKDLKKADYLIIPAKSPFTKEKNNLRLTFFKDLAIKNDLEVVYANFYGAHDSLIFDGLSFFINKDGKLKQATSFKEDFLVNDDFKQIKLDSSSEVLDKVIIGITSCLKEYAEMTGFNKVHIGVSGGIDSALVSYLAVKTFGSENVTGISLPSQFSSSGSVTDADQLAKNLNFKLISMPIQSVFEVSKDYFKEFFSTEGLTEENLQARLRGVFLMAYSNSQNSLLLNTGNKSEVAVGYCTLYGDMCGGISLIGDLFKTEVYELVKYINKKEEKEVIPMNIILKEPSAELRPGHKDKDSLPEYDILDKILIRYLIENESLETLYIDFRKEIVDNVISLYHISEYKRKQGPVIIKVSKKSFGDDFLVPISKNTLI